MDILRFDALFGPWDFGTIIDGLSSKMWIERYRETGEFTLTAPATDEMRAKLPIGCFISHLNTSEIMVVENHEIPDDKEAKRVLTISGRGLDTILERRVAGAFTVTNPPNYYVGSGYLLGAYDKPWSRALNLIKNHILNGLDAIPNTTAISEVGNEVGEFGDYDYIVLQQVYKALMDQLSIDDLGLKIVRPSPGTFVTNFVIHKGTDRTADVIFSFDTGEIVSADYLWSNKNEYNSAVVVTKFLQAFVMPVSVSGFERRTLMIDASDLDQQHTLTDYVNDAALTSTTVAAMQRRGRDILGAKNGVTLTRAETSKQISSYKYREDYDVGDTITIRGDYNTAAAMRVVEYVEIEDETGESSYPTLSLV